jgi:hypothetical protein
MMPFTWTPEAIPIHFHFPYEKVAFLTPIHAGVLHSVAPENLRTDRNLVLAVGNNVNSAVASDLLLLRYKAALVEKLYSFSGFSI